MSHNYYNMDSSYYSYMWHSAPPNHSKHDIAEFLRFVAAQWFFDGW